MDAWGVKKWDRNDRDYNIDDTEVSGVKKLNRNNRDYMNWYKL